MEIECIKISSVTYANKAREALKNNGIRARMRKSISANDGCAYFLEIDRKHFDKAVLTLQELGIRFEGCDFG